MLYQSRPQPRNLIGKRAGTRSTSRQCKGIFKYHRRTQCMLCNEVLLIRDAQALFLGLLLQLTGSRPDAANYRSESAGYLSHDERITFRRLRRLVYRGHRFARKVPVPAQLAAPSSATLLVLHNSVLSWSIRVRSMPLGPRKPRRTRKAG